MASPFIVRIKIADEVNENLKLAAWLREACENEMNGAFGSKDGSPPRSGIDGRVVQKWRDVVKAVEALTACQIKLDRNAKQMAEQMTPEDELEAVRSYIRSLDPSTRDTFLQTEMQWLRRH